MKQPQIEVSIHHLASFSVSVFASLILSEWQDGGSVYNIKLFDPLRWPRSPASAFVSFSLITNHIRRWQTEMRSWKRVSERRSVCFGCRQTRRSTAVPPALEQAALGLSKTGTNSTAPETLLLSHNFQKNIFNLSSVQMFLSGRVNVKVNGQLACKNDASRQRAGHQNTRLYGGDPLLQAAAKTQDTPAYFNRTVLAQLNLSSQGALHSLTTFSSPAGARLSVWV